jgi:hypothetical protein
MTIGRIWSVSSSRAMQICETCGGTKWLAGLARFKLFSRQYSSLGRLIKSDALRPVHRKSLALIRVKGHQAAWSSVWLRLVGLGRGCMGADRQTMVGVISTATSWLLAPLAIASTTVDAPPLRPAGEGLVAHASPPFSYEMGGSPNPVAHLYLYELVGGLGVFYFSVASKTTSRSCVSQCGDLA